MNVVLVGGLFGLAVLSGMLGLGVAFVAVPFLSFFMDDLVHQVQPLSLLLNGVTALFSVFGFAVGGLVDWRKAIALAVVTTAVAPLGAWLVQYVPQVYVWVAYFVAVGFLAYRLFRPVRAGGHREERFGIALALAVPISVVAGFLGVGPGFLLLPVLILAGFEPKRAAAINAFAVMPPSFSALIPHLSTATWDLPLTGTLVVVGALGSFIGARTAVRWVAGARLKQIFGVLIVVVTGYRLLTLLN